MLSLVILKFSLRRLQLLRKTYFPKQIASDISEDKLTDTVDSNFLDEGGYINKYAPKLFQNRLKSKLFINKLR